jgi:hypothetical protein
MSKDQILEGTHGMSSQKPFLGFTIYLHRSYHLKVKLSVLINVFFESLTVLLYHKAPLKNLAWISTTSTSETELCKFVVSS